MGWERERERNVMGFNRRGRNKKRHRERKILWRGRAQQQQNTNH